MFRGLVQTRHFLSSHFEFLQGSDETSKCLNLVPDLSTSFTLSPVTAMILDSVCLNCWRSWLFGVCWTNMTETIGGTKSPFFLCLVWFFFFSSRFFFFPLNQFSLWVSFFWSLVLSVTAAGLWRGTFSFAALATFLSYPSISIKMIWKMAWI